MEDHNQLFNKASKYVANLRTKHQEVPVKLQTDMSIKLLEASNLAAEGRFNDSNKVLKEIIGLLEVFK